MDNSDSNSNSGNDQLAEKVLGLNKNSGYPLPSKQEILLLLNNAEMKNMFTYSCSLIEKQSEIGRMRRVLSFNTLYNDKINSLASLKKRERDLNGKLKEKRDKLELLKQKRAEIEKMNQQLLNQTKDNSKRRQLAELKTKILTASKMELAALIDKLNSLSCIEHYKYSQNKPGIDNNEDNQEFDINTYIEKASDLITLNNTLITQSDFNKKNINKDNTTTTVNQGMTIQLPKISKKDLKAYVQLNQGEFWLQIKKSIEALSTFKLTDSKDNTKDKDSLFDQSNSRILNNTDNSNDYSTICKSFLEAIQKEEELLSIQYNRNQANDDHLSLIKENQSLIKAYKIPTEDIKRISSYAKAKLAKDILNHISSKTVLKQQQQEEEFIIPQCIIKDDYNDIITYEKTLMKTYRKYKLRTESFISKRIIPLSDLLEEKYTDFTNTMKIEIDYFNKLQLKNFDRRKDAYSLSRLKYDKETLRAFKVNSKYDLFSLYFKYIDGIMRDNRQLDDNKKQVDSIYKHKAYNEYANKSKLVDEIKKFNKTFNFDQQYRHLINDDKQIEAFKSLVALWGNIEYLNYDINITSLKNKFG